MYSNEELNKIISDAESGDECAKSVLYNYGLMLRRGVPKNLKKTIDIWRKAAELEIPEAAGNLAELYKAGSNDTGDNKVERNPKEAAKYYNLAADILEKNGQLASEAQIKDLRERAASLIKE